jgi:predicted PurR-regulated permease PerM
VLVPAVIWLFWSGQTGWGDLPARHHRGGGHAGQHHPPLLIRMGADLPLMLIFAGVIGGLLAFGLVGIFVGPVVLAVAWRLLAGLDTVREFTRICAQPAQIRNRRPA